MHLILIIALGIVLAYVMLAVLCTEAGIAALLAVAAIVAAIAFVGGGIALICTGTPWGVVIGLMILVSLAGGVLEASIGKGARK